MKPSVVLIAALAGFGGWLYIQVSPYPANQRLHRFKQLPGIESVVEWNEMRKVQAAFDAAEDGVVSITRRGETTSWSSFDDWKADFDEHGRDARFWYNKLINANAFEELHQQADEGSFSALRVLSMIGIEETSGGKDVFSALQNGSAAGAWWTGLMENSADRISYMQSREGMLRRAQMMQENLRWPGMSPSEFDQQTQHNQASMAELERQAEAGEPDAVWIMGQLHGDTPVRIRVPD